MDIIFDNPVLKINPEDSELLVSLTNIRPEVNDNKDEEINIWLIILPVAILVVIIVLVLLFYIKSRKNAS